MLLVGILDRVDKLLKDIHKIYPLKNLGEVKDTIFLGLHIVRHDSIFTVDQARYSRLIVDKFHIATPSTTPMESRFKPRDDAPAFDTRTNQSAIGSLLYLALGTRPDITFAVNRLAQFASQPNADHWQAVTKLIGYVLDTLDYGITLGKPSAGITLGNPSVSLPDSSHLSGYFDASYGDNTDAHSTCGYIFFYHGQPVSLRSKKQHIVGLSSTEAEYVAATEAAKEAGWFASFFNGIGYPITLPTVLFGDNHGANFLKIVQKFQVSSLRSVKD